MPKFIKASDCKTCAYQSHYSKGLLEADSNELHHSCITVAFRKGENICKQGTDVTHALFVGQGMIKVFIEGKNKNIIIQLMQAGDYLGLHSLFGDRKYHFSAEALDDVVVCMIEADKFIEIAKRNNEFLFSITHSISDCANCFHEKMIDLNQKQVRGRLADTLLYLADEIYHNTNFETSLTRKELAELSDMSVENAVRTMTEMKNEGIIRTEGKTIEILHPEVLKKMSQMG